MPEHLSVFLTPACASGGDFAAARIRQTAVRLHDGESIENALRRFKRQVLHKDIIQRNEAAVNETRTEEAIESPS
jgi:ribosomal protein S21